MRPLLLALALLAPSAASSLELRDVPLPKPPMPPPADAIHAEFVARPARVGQAAPKPGPSKKLREVRLSGSVNLSGYGFVPRGSTWATLTVSGWTTLSDQDGRYWQGSIQVSDTRTYFVSGSYVSGWAQPSATVALYESGRYVGTLYLSGTVLVSGFANNGSVNLSGFGTVSGSALIDEPETPKPEPPKPSPKGR